MPKRALIVEPLRHLPGVVEIVGFGRVRPPSGQAQELEVAVALSDVGDGAGQGHLRWVGCGQLDVLHAGSRWLSGEEQAARGGETVSGSFRFAAGDVVGTGTDHRARGNPPFRSASIKDASAFCLVRTTPVVRGEDSREIKMVLLPHMELVRALWGVSGRLLLEMFDGIRDPAVASNRGLVDRARSGRVDDRTVRLTARRWLSRFETILAAAIVADPRMGRFHDFVYQQLSVSRNFRRGLPEYVRLFWPWGEPIELTAEGRWIERMRSSGGTEWRFLLTRLTSIGFRVPFDRIDLHFTGGNIGDVDRLPPSNARRRDVVATKIVMVTARPSSSARRPSEVRTPEVAFPNVADVEIREFRRDGGLGPQAASAGFGRRDEAMFGTGGDMSGVDPQVGRAVVTRATGLDAVATARKALERTWDALRMACDEAGWRLDAFPRSISASRGTPHGEPNFDHEPLVARALVADARVFVVDRGSFVGDRCSLGILVPRDRRTSDEELADVAWRLSKDIDGRWRSPAAKSDHFDVWAMNRRPQVWDDAETYANALRRRIASKIGPGDCAT